mgnify:CR=1 FL=1
MKQQIIDISIKHWNERFVGISAYDIAKELKLSHNEVMEYLVQLKRENKGTLNENVSLYQVSININEETDNVKTEHNTIVTHIFFPSKDILERFYLENLNKFLKNGEYKNRLHRGYSQIDLAYFDIEVLRKYIRNKEMYTIDDDVTGGLLKLNPNYLNTLPDDEIEKIYFNKIWYGKRKLLNGNVSVSAILSDLSKLSSREQSYWHSFELENPEFTENDVDFNRFVTRAYYGNWVKSDDPLFEISKEINNANNIFEFKLFRDAENTYLTYPINNTLKEFADCNSELFKLIGPDNLIKYSIKKIYLEFLNGKHEELINTNSGKAFSQIQILNLVLKKLNKELAEDFKRVWDKIKQKRIIADHKISKPDYTSINYIDCFRKNSDEVRDILRRINIELKKLNGV